MSDTLDKLKAINELRHRGSTQAERDNAKEKLDTLCLKYNISIDELDEQRAQGDTAWYGFKVRDLMEFHILVQCVWYITERIVESITDEPGLRMAFSLSESEIRVCTMGINEFLKVWREDSCLILQSFVMKHKLFGPTDQLPKKEDSKSPQVSAEENRKRTIRMMAIMDELTACGWEKPVKDLKQLN